MATKKPWQSTDIDALNNWLGFSGEQVESMSMDIDDLKKAKRILTGENSSEAAKVGKTLTSLQKRLKELKANRVKATRALNSRIALHERVRKRQQDLENNAAKRMAAIEDKARKARENRLAKAKAKLGQTIQQDKDQTNPLYESIEKKIEEMASLGKEIKLSAEEYDAITDTMFQRYQEVRDHARYVASRKRKEWIKQGRTLQKAAFTNSSNLARIRAKTEGTLPNNNLSITNAKAANSDNVVGIGKSIKTRGPVVNARVSQKLNPELFNGIKELNFGLGDKIEKVVSVLGAMNDDQQKANIRADREADKLAQERRVRKTLISQETKDKIAGMASGGFDSLLKLGLGVAGVWTLFGNKGFPKRTITTITRWAARFKKLKGFLTGDQQAIDEADATLDSLKDEKGVGWKDALGALGIATLIPGVGGLVRGGVKGVVKGGFKGLKWAGKGAVWPLMKKIGTKLGGKALAGRLGGALARFGGRLAIGAALGPETMGVGTVIMTIVGLAMLAWDLLSDSVKDKIKGFVSNLASSIWTGVKDTAAAIYTAMKSLFLGFYKWLDDETGGLLSKSVEIVGEKVAPTVAKAEEVAAQHPVATAAAGAALAAMNPLGAVGVLGYSTLKSMQGSPGTPPVGGLPFDSKYADRITSGVGTRASPGGFGSTNHKGTDIAMPSGSPIYAPADGRIMFAGWDSKSKNGKEKKGYGQYVMVQGADGQTHLMGHLSSIKVRTGDTVKAGQLLGSSGETGGATGPHLHYEIRQGAVDKQSYFASASVLNPASYIKAQMARGSAPTLPPTPDHVAAMANAEAMGTINQSSMGPQASTSKKVGPYTGPSINDGGTHIEDKGLTLANFLLGAQTA